MGLGGCKHPLIQSPQDGIPYDRNPSVALKAHITLEVETVTLKLQIKARNLGVILNDT